MIDRFQDLQYREEVNSTELSKETSPRETDLSETLQVKFGAMHENKSSLGIIQEKELSFVADECKVVKDKSKVG